MKIRAVEDSADLRAFIDLPYGLHRDDPMWVPPLRIDVRARLSMTKNPFFDHAEARYFLAERNGRVQGRIAAIANRRHDEIYGDGAAFFGFFDCVDDVEVASALFDTAAGWAAARGYSELRGPTSFSTNDECGLLIEGFDTPPTLMMPHNPPYYVDLLRAAGFAKSKDLLAFFVPHTVPVADRARRAVQRVGQRLGVTVRGFDPGDFDGEVERIKQAYNAGWERNWGFVPMSDREIEHLARQLKPFYVPELIPFAEKDGRLVGFGLSMPDLNEFLRSNRRGRLFPTALKILWARRRGKFRRMRVLLLGILPEFRGKGVDALLWHWIWDNTLALGFHWGEAGWILEDNAPMRNAAERMGFSHYKTFRLFERSLRR